MGIGDDPTLRRREDLDALALLGAQQVHLDHHDCIYRTDNEGQPLVAREPDIFAESIEPGLLRALTDDLVSVVARTGASRLFLPLALGGHRDHVIARQAGEALAGRQGHVLDVCYYEDTPYVLAEPEALSEATRGMRSQLFPLTADELSLRLEAIMRYRSQQALLWHRAGLLLAIRDYALQLGKGRPTERYWLAI